MQVVLALDIEGAADPSQACRQFLGLLRAEPQPGTTLHFEVTPDGRDDEPIKVSLNTAPTSTVHAVAPTARADLRALRTRSTTSPRPRAGYRPNLSRTEAMEVTAMRVEIIGWREPGTDQLDLAVFIDGTLVGHTVTDLSQWHGEPSDGYESLCPGVDLTVVDPGRGWDNQLDLWRSHRDEWMRAASPAAAALILALHDRGETTGYVTP